MKAEIGKTYRHYKNQKTYIVLHFATHTETSEQTVVYQGLYDTDDLGPKPIFVRPKDMFEETVAVDGVLKDRFAAI